MKRFKVTNKNENHNRGEVRTKFGNEPPSAKSIGAHVLKRQVDEMVAKFNQVAETLNRPKFSEANRVSTKRKLTARSEVFHLHFV